jgi:hypothetical protein
MADGRVFGCGRFHWAPRFSKTLASLTREQASRLGELSRRVQQPRLSVPECFLMGDDPY